ncbi:hypothetical protein EXN66_Car002483 [Channa argus]|uniref:Uncharacterized protein n=1 Tax=Channa argus TaxID=215402 RepID=A0A6G1P943_CHAAH|nr:hypothetical protein EXN66_Car002483 [Channa argus]
MVPRLTNNEKDKVCCYVRECVNCVYAETKPHFVAKDLFQNMLVDTHFGLICSSV